MSLYSRLIWSTTAALPVAFALLSGCSSDDTSPAEGSSVDADTTAAPGRAGTNEDPISNAPPPPTGGSSAGPNTTPNTVTPPSTPPAPGSSNDASGGASAAGGGTSGPGSATPAQGGSEASGGNAGEVVPGGAGPSAGGAAGGAGGDASTAGASPGGTGSSSGGSAGEMSAGGGGTATAGAGGADGQTASDPFSPGCGTPITRPDRNVQQTMDIGGTTRYYLLDVPANADNQSPLMLIFALHGYDMNNVAVKDLYNFTARSNGQAITVMPQGEGPPPGNVSHWGDGVLESTWSPNEANYAYLEALIDTLGESYCIDRTRIFIVGFSMGAFFTNAIACAHNDWFRAFAPIAGGGPSACDDGVQAAIMIQHGTADPIVDISSGEGSRDIWLEQNGCSQSSQSSFNGCQSYEGCPEGKPVVWCTGNFDHYIPDSTTSNIWAFFSGL